MPSVKFTDTKIPRSPLLSRLFLLLICLWFGVGLANEEADQLRPEQSIVDDILAGEQPEGVVFLVMEDDEEALRWVMPRVMTYTLQLRGHWPRLPIILLSHGEEMFSLLDSAKSLYPDIHLEARKLVAEYQVHFQLCGSFAAMSDFTATDFADFLDVVPSAPAEIETYRLMDFDIVNLELTW